MTEYEQKCLELDKELAELLGWHRIYFDKFVWCGDNPSLNIINRNLPRWTQDDAEAFRLVVDYSLFDNTMSIWKEDFIFPDRTAATRFAIVRAVINKLKGN